MSGTKDIKLRAFEISNTSVSKEHSDLFSKLHERLNSSANVNDRKMDLNSSDDTNKEQDLISYYNEKAKSGSPIFCILLRASIDDSVQHIDAELLEKQFFTIEELKETKLGPGIVYKRHFYFTAYKNHLVTSLPGNTTIKGLQTYLNWYLDELYEINPKIDNSKISELSNIENIKVVDPAQKELQGSADPSSGAGVSGFTKTLRNLSKELIRNFIQDAPSLKEEQLEQMISAELILKFRKPKADDPESLKQAYSALLKPVADVENYQIKRRNASTVYSGKDILESKTVSIEKLDGEAINEQHLEQEMRKYILELEAHA